MAGVDVSTNVEEIHDLRSLLAGDERDFLIRNNGDQVKMSNLDGKTIGLYFSASWCGPCRNFTPKLVEAYNEIASKGNEFEVVFITSDKDEDGFHAYFSKMPWLAIPFSDAKTCGNLKKLFKVRGIPHLVVLDGSGKVLSTDVVDVISEHGSEVYPFTPERITKIREDEEAAKREQTLRSVLASPSRDYLVSNNSSRVPISDLEGKTVGLYFFISRSKSCHEFTPKLAATCSKLEEKGENFEIVLVPLDEKESSFEESFTNMPWLAIPFGDRSCEKLARYFEIRSIPTLAVIGPDGKTLVTNATDLVEEHGVEAFPFSPEKLEELVEKEKVKLESQTLESLLVSGKLDYVIGNGGNKVSVSELVGKNILLYFSAQWCGPCRAFLPKLIELYHKIKKLDNAFEIIFISSDREEKSYEEFFASMPWLALPFGDERKKVLSRRFKIRGIPSLVAIGSTGRTVTHDAKKPLVIHGADAYPFTEEKIKELEARVEEMAKAWPKKVNHQLHEAHELILTRQNSYGCDGCGELGYGWSYHCSECDFDLHPMCVLKEEKDSLEAEEKEGQAANKEGYVCDGDVCRRA